MSTDVWKWVYDKPDEMFEAHTGFDICCRRACEPHLSSSTILYLDVTFNGYAVDLLEYLPTSDHERLRENMDELKEAPNELRQTYEEYQGIHMVFLIDSKWWTAA